MTRACDWPDWLGGGESAASSRKPAEPRASLHTIITPLDTEKCASGDSIRIA